MRSDRIRVPTGVEWRGALAALVLLCMATPFSGLARENLSDARQMCAAWHDAVERKVAMQHSLGILSASTAQAIRDELDAVSARCTLEPVRPLLDRYAALDTMLYDESKDVQLAEID